MKETPRTPGPFHSVHTTRRLRPQDALPGKAAPTPDASLQDCENHVSVVDELPSHTRHTRGHTLTHGAICSHTRAHTHTHTWVHAHTRVCTQGCMCTGTQPHAPARTPLGSPVLVAQKVGKRWLWLPRVSLEGWSAARSRAQRVLSDRGGPFASASHPHARGTEVLTGAAGREPHARPLLGTRGC